MRVGIMQPYLFPYIGYFQLIGAVDTFVIHDDCQWIKQGWINRNRILVNGKPRFFTVPVKRAPFHAMINERHPADNADQAMAKILRQIHGAYEKAPYFRATYDLVARCFSVEPTDMAEFATNSVVRCCRYLGLPAPTLRASKLVSNNSSGQQRVLDICAAVGADHYINPIGGVDLYDHQEFRRNGFDLSFLKARNTPYQQFGDEFSPFLSIIDVMMFNSPDEIREMLEQYDLK